MMKSKLIILLFFTAILFEGFAQVAPGIYLIEFTDKNNSGYSVDNPEEFLSSRAIDRRERFNIPITEHDFPVNQLYIDSISKLDLQIRHTSKWFNSLIADISEPNVIDALNAISFVKNVTKKVSIYKKSKRVEDFTEVSSFEYDLNKKKISVVQENTFDYGAYEYQITMLNGQFLHNNNFSGEGMIIAVNDAGFYRADQMIAFEQLRSRNGILGVKDFVELDDTVYNDHYHGAYVLSIIAANNPGIAVGSAPEAEFYLFGTENNDSEYIVEEENWIAAIEYADSAGVDILTSSVSYYIFNDPDQDHTFDELTGNSTRITRAADFAASKGMLVINSAGNEGNSDWQYLTFPGDADSAMAIGAIDSLGLIAGFSSISPPNYHIVKPNVVALGVQTYILNTNDALVQSNGTSYSTPIIAGLAACLWQSFPDKTNYEIIKAIEQSANRYNNPDVYYGNGVPDFRKAYDILSGNASVDDLNTNQFEYFPNPFEEEIRFRLNNVEGNQVNVFIADILGKEIFNTSFERNSTNDEYAIKDLNVLLPGIYFLRIETGSYKFTEKILKQY